MLKIYNYCILVCLLFTLSEISAQTTELIKGGSFKTSDLSSWTIGINASGESGNVVFGNTTDLPLGSKNTTCVKFSHGGAGTPEIQMYQRVKLLAGVTYKISARLKAKGNMATRAAQIYIVKDAQPDNGTMFSDAIINTGERSKSVALYLEGWPFSMGETQVDINGEFPISKAGPGTDLIAPEADGDYLILFKVGQWGAADPYTVSVGDLSLVTTANENIPVTSVTLPATATLNSIGATTSLNALVIPTNATNKTMSWSSSNNAVATVSVNGLISAVSNGTAEITATTQEGGITSKCLVTVLFSSFKLVWSDEFNGTGVPDPAKWGNELGYIRNNELQSYTKSTNNANQNNGNLEITVRKEPTGGKDYSSASIITKGKADWAYGKIEGRFKMPNGKGLWPCFWTLGANYEEVWWPKCGEIDIFEHINSENLIHSTAHWENALGAHVSSGHDSPALDVTQWHVYSIEWTPMSIKWFVDGVQHHELNISNGINNTLAFHKPQYLLINFPIGGSWPGSPDATTVLPATMYCDYVRVYEWATDVAQHVSSIIVSPSALNLPKNNTIQLSISFIPYVATNKTINWQSSNNAVATVNSNGIISGVGAGTATITATTTDGGKTATTTVKVIESSGLNFVVNPGFELDNAEVQKPQNWQEWSPNTPSSIDNAKVVKGNAHSGNYYGSMTGSAKYDVMTFQNIKDLPSGKYTLKAWVRSSGGQAYSILSIKNYGGTEIIKPLNYAINTWTQIVINDINITTGQCEIDIYNSANAGQWLEYDDVELSLSTTTSTHSRNNGRDISIFPNPVTSNVLTISNADAESYNVSITSINGQAMYAKQNNSGNINVNTSSFVRGSYLVRVTSKNESFVRLVLVE